jgi:hypothetical protein
MEGALERSRVSRASLLVQSNSPTYARWLEAIAAELAHRFERGNELQAILRTQALRRSHSLIEALCDALRHHGFGGGGVNCLDLVSERGAEPSEPATIGPLRGLP